MKCYVSVLPEILILHSANMSARHIWYFQYFRFLGNARLLFRCKHVLPMCVPQVQIRRWVREKIHKFESAENEVRMLLNSNGNFVTSLILSIFVVFHIF